MRVANSFIHIVSLLLTPVVLASCVFHQPPTDTALSRETVPIGIIPILEGQDARRSWFSKLVLNPPKGTIVGRPKASSFCTPQRELKWETGSQILKEADIRAAFNEVLQKGNYPVVGKADSLFEDVSGAELILAGLVKEIKADLCNEETSGFLVPTQLAANTDLSLKVNWQVFSRVEGRVVYKTATDGKYSGRGTFRACVIAAFANATERLLADRTFFELVVAPKKDQGVKTMGTGKGIAPHQVVPRQGRGSDLVRAGAESNARDAAR